MLSHMIRAGSALPLARAVAPATLIAALAVVGACSDQSRTLAPTGGMLAGALAAIDVVDGTYFGRTIPLGPGIARTYITFDGGTVTEFGVELNAGAVQGLPTTGVHGSHGNEHHSREHEFELPLPAEAGVTAYRSVNIGWMPSGHEKPYDRPHFDFHFYLITAAERAAIDPSDPAWAQKAGSFPAPAYWPQRYFPLSALVGKPPALVTVPRMGMHWLDIASPELHGAPFTHTFFYGSWNGAMIFDEPMITRELLESRSTVDVTLPPAARYAPAGLRAGGYRVYWDETTQRHRVALTQLAERS